MKDEQYTYEDYIKDFELDHLGFDGVPDESAPDAAPENISDKDIRDTAAINKRL